MSIRHCIAGVVLVVAGGMAVNAYEEQSAAKSTPDEALLIAIADQRREAEELQQKADYAFQKLQGLRRIRDTHGTYPIPAKGSGSGERFAGGTTLSLAVDPRAIAS